MKKLHLTPQLAMVMTFALGLSCTQDKKKSDDYPTPDQAFCKVFRGSSFDPTQTVWVAFFFEAGSRDTCQRLAKEQNETYPDSFYQCTCRPDAKPG